MNCIKDGWFSEPAKFSCLSSPNFNRQAEMPNEYQKLEAGLKKEMETLETLQLELDKVK
jgi:hypothetical protein